MKQNWKAVVTLAVVVGGCTTFMKLAAAQVTDLVSVRGKVGVFLPRGDARDFAGSTHFNAEVDVAVPFLGAGRTFVSAGYYQGSEGGRKLRMIPLTIGKVFSPPNPASGITGNLYFGAGVGAYLLRASGHGDSESKTRPGAFAMAGYQFPNAYFVEAKYHIVGSVGGVSPRGLALMVGRSF